MKITLPIALQLYSIRDMAENDLLGALQQAKSLGYDGVEFAGFFNMPADVIKTKLEELALIPLSSHAKLEEIFPDYKEFVAYHREIGCQYIAISWVKPEHRPNGSDYQEFVEKCGILADKCEKAGIILLYHNHEFEFDLLEDGSYGLDRIYRDLPKIKAEMDTCWITVGGENPRVYLEKYQKRCPIIHLKDFLIAQNGRAAKLYEKLKGEGRLLPKMLSPNQDFDFRPIGQGMLDVEGVVLASKVVEAEWFVVEQDRSSNRPTLQSAKESIEFLRDLSINRN